MSERKQLYTDALLHLINGWKNPYQFVQRVRDGYEKELDALHAELDAIKKRLDQDDVRNWEPGPEIWHKMPTKFNWLTGTPEGTLFAWVEKPDLLRDRWWAQGGDVHATTILLPLGFDWRLAIWKRPNFT